MLIEFSRIPGGKLFVKQKMDSGYEDNAWGEINAKARFSYPESSPRE